MEDRQDSIISLLFWIFRYVCLPITLPILSYKVISKFLINRSKSSIQGKVVVITGASSGLGEALAHCFYSQGCRVILAARRQNELERVKRDLLSLKLSTPTTFPPYVLPLDLADITDLKNKIQNIYDEYGHIDILINNGGISNRGTILNTAIDVDMQVMAVNYFGPVALTKAVLPKMIVHKNGQIVFVSSVQGRIALPERSCYGASKHALQAFADTLRAEVAQSNIKVSIISPGYIKTAFSINALTETGKKYGAMDKTTASGYSPEYVANEILNVVVEERPELIICSLQPKLAIFIRYFIPSLYFRIMADRAKK